MQIRGPEIIYFKNTPTQPPWRLNGAPLTVSQLDQSLLGPINDFMSVFILDLYACYVRVLKLFAMSSLHLSLFCICM